MTPAIIALVARISGEEIIAERKNDFYFQTGLTGIEKIWQVLYKFFHTCYESTNRIVKNEERIGMVIMAGLAVLALLVILHYAISNRKKPEKIANYVIFAVFALSGCAGFLFLLLYRDEGKLLQLIIFAACCLVCLITGFLIFTSIFNSKYRKEMFFPTKRVILSDIPLAIGTTFLLICGAIAIYSIGPYKVYLASSASDYVDGSGVNPDDTFIRQGIFMVVSTIAMIIVSWHKPSWFRRIASLLTPLMFVLLLFAAIMGLNSGSEYARSFLGIQPSEIAKIALILYFAMQLEENYYTLTCSPIPSSKSVFSYRQDYELRLAEKNKARAKNGLPPKKFALRSWLYNLVWMPFKSATFLSSPSSSLEKYNPTPNNLCKSNIFLTLKYIFITLIFAGLTLLGNHLSGTILILLICFALLLISDSSHVLKPTVILCCGGGLILLVVIYILHEPIYNFCVAHSGSGINHIFSTLGSLVNKLYTRNNAEDNEQVVNALVALGRGGLTGVGIGNSALKRFYVPVSESDMIFSIIGEETGFLGCLVLIFAYIFVIFRCIKIGKEAGRISEKYVAFGVAIHIFIQVAGHIFINTNGSKNTGITLPFISQGGSALLAQCIEIGFVLSIARANRLRKLTSEITEEN